MTPEELDALARELHHEWESPGLWPRIARAVAPRRRRWLLGAGVGALAAGLALAIYFVPARREAVVAERSPLLTEQALAEVSSAEAAYLKSIEKLGRLAGPRLARPETTLTRAYAEKIALLDGAIGDLRAEMERNGFNAQLHLQMAALYRDKQQTLEQVIRHE